MNKSVSLNMSHRPSFIELHAHKMWFMIVMPDGGSQKVFILYCWISLATLLVIFHFIVYRLHEYVNICLFVSFKH